MTSTTETETAMQSDQIDQIDHIDYKNIPALNAHLNPHARVLGRKRTQLSAKGQRNLAQAVKRARFMALIPYINH